VTELDDALKNLTPRQRDLLLRRLGKAPAKEAAAPAADRIEPLPRRAGGDDVFVLSFAQQRLWFLDRLEPGSAFYNLPASIAVAGPLDPAALGASLHAIVSRHEPLRTTFETRAGGPVQVVHPVMDEPLALVDLRALPETIRAAESERLAKAEAERPFDLTRGPLLRTVLARLGEEDWRILLTLHHIVSDGWSMGVLVREMAVLYPALRAGEELRLPELPVQYADYAAWQRRLLQGERLERQMAFWRQRLAGAPVLQLPTDRPRPPVQRFRGRHQHRILAEESMAGFRALCRREGATLFMGMLALFQALLARHAGVDDLVVGTPVAGRDRAEIQGLIGFFLNSVALRGELSADPSFRGLLERTRRATLAAFAHQEVPFEKLVEELAPERDLGHAPLFQVMLVQQNAPAEPLRLAGLTLIPGDVEGSMSKYDLTLNFQETPDGSMLRWLSNRDLFDAATVARLAAHFERLLVGAAAEPELRLSELPLLTTGEAQQLVEWNDTAAARPAAAGLHELIAAQVERRPAAVAVSFEGEELSYRELDEAANALARRLEAAGAGPETVVGVLAERSLEMVVGLLAVLKVGGAYLPLDPDYPAERLGFMLADSAVPVVLAQERLLARLPEHAACVVPLDGAAAERAGRPGYGAGAASLAYVIYTSGSTGRPKGTMNTHRGIVNRLLWMQERYGLTPADRVLQKTPYSFDVSVWEFFWPLLVGARLVLARPGGHQDPGYLVRTIKDEGITTLHFVPSMLQVFLEAPGVEDCSSLRRTVCSGEALPAELERRFFERLPAAELHNLYGPTEAAVDVTSWACERDSRRSSVPIGYPVANTRIHIVDRGLRPVPIGVAGELLIGGVQVGRGYLARPELTAERFMPDAFSATAGTRLYRTGDLARRLADGAVDFLGRIDHQIKVRGLRIELGEIESALAEHAGVREAVVVARSDGEAVGAVNLVAYVTARQGGAPPTLSELRQRLSLSLPEYMLPAALVVLEAMPLTASGKVDRKALPAPQRETAAPRERVAPRTELERYLAELWSETLTVPAASFGVHDSFFALGGNSITGAILINQLQETLGEIVHVVVIFDAPTPAALAALLAREYPRAVRRLWGEESPGEASGPAAGEAGAADRSLRALEPLAADGAAGSGRTFPLSFSQERLWFLDQLDPGKATYNIPAALRLRGRLDLPALSAALAAVARRHAALRTSFALAGDQPVQVVAPPAASSRPALALADLSALPAAARETELRRRINAEAERPFDLARGPLLRVLVLRLAGEEHVAALTLHHIVSDGWSMGILIRELTALYAGGGAASLPELPIQYADFAVWQREWLSGERLASEVAYWRQRLAGAPALSDLPADRPRPAVQRYRGRHLRRSLPPAVAGAVRDLCRDAGVTPFLGLLAAFQALVSRHTGRTDVVVGTPVAGRNRRETEGLIGLFLNSVVLRNDLSGDPEFRELLDRARRTALEAFVHQEVPFEKLVEVLAPERSLSHAPVFQLLLVLQNASREALELPGLTLEPLEIEIGAAKLDVSLSVQESADGGLELLWLYNRDLFDPPTIDRLSGHLARLLEGAGGNPALRLSELPLLTPQEQVQLLAWNDTAAAYPSTSCLHELIAAQVGRSPEEAAVSFEGEELRYRELDGAADALARRLASAGVGPETVVGVLAERSLEMVVGLLAVLKAGGAYLPLDPDYPAERLGFMLADSAAPVVLAQERLLARLPEHRAQVELLDDAAAKRGARPSGGAKPSNLAYAIYTSGSTGRPKGTLNTHRGIVNRLLWMQERYGLTAEDRVLQKTPYSFDVSVWELFWPLLAGARLVMARPGGHQDPAYLVRTIRDEGITTLHFVPSMLQVFLEAPGVEECRSLRRVVCSGEALPAGLERRFFARLPAVELHNLYGPTEAAVDVTHWACIPEDGRGAVPIGHPVANTQIHLLDAAGNPVPVGVAGELHIGGVQVGRGYLARPELTAEAFVPDAFSAAPGSRLYRTGDLARRLPDGAVDFLGRIDHQVKLRGLRIELGEIEAAMAGHPAVREAVVTARADGEAVGAVNLAAYVTLRQGAAGPPSLAELRERLARSLPEYMLPSALVVLEAMPLTASGKVDRKALPAPERAPAGERRRVAPRTELERFLAGLWSAVLGLEAASIGVEDNFFQIGGNSITGAILINRLQRELGAIVHVVTIFDAPTIGQLAAHLAGEYPEAVERLWGQESLPGVTGERTSAPRVGEAEIAAVRRLIGALPAAAVAGSRNPPAVFILSPPRSGSTLLRVMLGGNPRLFAPPELELLNFNTLAERRQAFPGRDAFRLEGALRAVMEARGMTAEEATELVAGYEREGMSTRELYHRLQEWIGDRLLVDKTPTYAWDPSALWRAEETFAQPRYVHLVRHPYGMIRSFEEARIDQIFFHREHPLSRRGLAEALWVLAHRNTLEFLAGVPAERQHSLRFENLLRDPEGELRALCSFLGVDYHPAMAAPYEKTSARMTDGLHAESRMLGDVKFHQHQGVDARVAERWREEYREDFLGEPAQDLAGRLGYETRPAASWAPIAARAGAPGQPLPLSFAQERLWFLEQLDPGKATYNLPNALRLTGALDVRRLAGALGEVVRRHAVLRTTFAEVEGRPAQLVSHHAGLAFAVVDLSALPAAERAGEARRLVSLEVDHPFDLARGPLLRALLLRLAPAEHEAVLTMHHIVSDGWSMGVLVREMAALYAGSPPPEPPIQYADFARWQREWLQGEVLESELAYWRKRLSGVPPLELPADRPRPPVQRFRGAAHPLSLSRPLRDGLAALSRREGATLFMGGLAALVALLARYTGQDDIAVGTPSANRNRAEIEELIGFFVNTLVVRTDAGCDPSFRRLLACVQEASVGAFAHQDLPFEKVVEELRPERDLSRAPLFQVMFILQNATSRPLELAGLRLDPEPFEVTTSKFDLTLSLFEDSRGMLAGSLEYDTDLFEAATVARWAGHLEVLLQGIVAAPERRISELPLLGEAERRMLLADWNATAVSWPRATLLHELFEHQAAARPEAWAVGFGAERLTYGELEERSNRLARHLRRLGVGSEVRVGLCVDRSAEMVVALLGILKSGGAYVPLDPAHPSERLGLVLEDSGVPVLVTEERLLGTLPAHGARVVCLDRDGAVIERESGASLERIADAENLAYVLYTSGSTGRPKGVGLSHRAVVNFLRAMRERPGLRETDVVPALTTLSFDIAGLEIYLPLAVGGRVEVLDREEAADGARLAARLAETGATLVQATPATWRLLIDSGWQGMPGLKILCGGEALPRDLAEALLGRELELWNVYGPTETAIWSAVGQVAPGEGPVLLGAPIANTELYVVDRQLALAPVGIPGELLIGGAGLARGYQGRPDLTAEKFVPHPFTAVPGARIYRTGDLVRYRPSGELEFLGRIDHQVKVRGFRIELGEIEAALIRHSSVRQAVVAVREHGGNKSLVGYLVADPAPPAGELRETLRRSLPEYMIPAAFVILESLPLTPSGKVDRKALPAPEAWQSSTERYVAPAGLTEELVAAIWAEVLHAERIGAADNFFDLGGHSLVATQVMSRLRATLGVELPLRALFEVPTVRGLARAVEQARLPGDATSLAPISPVPRDAGALPLSFAQERMWFLHQLDPELTAFNVGQVLHLRGAVNFEALERALEVVCCRHESLRTVFAADQGEPRQVILPPASVPLARVDLRGIAVGARQREMDRRAAELANLAFGRLSSGPLFRIVLIELAEDDCAIAFLMHHIISDAWALRRLVGEAAALYTAELQGRPPVLPELPIQYADFAVWQRQWLAGETLARQLDYWKRQLAGAPPLLAVPTDRPRPAVQSSRGARVRLDIAAEVYRGIRELGRRRTLTPFMILLASFEALLWRYTRAADLVVGVPIANRNRAEIENLIGTFVNMLVLRTRLAGSTPSFLELCDEVRDVGLAAFAHQDLPFEKLVSELQPERSLSYSPLFQVLFNLQNQPMRPLELPGLSLTAMPTSRSQAQVDLTLAISESLDGERLTGFFGFTTSLFDATTIERMAGHFSRLLAVAVANPERLLSELPLLAEGERCQLLTEWSDTQTERSHGLLIHDLFGRRAAAAPAAPAVSFGPEVMSYGEIDARSNRLANHLRGLGVGPEVRVGLCLGRTPEMVVGLLGVLKAGGAYVPLDPSHPAERLALVLADAGVAVLVTEARWLAVLPPHDAPAVCLDRDREAIAAASAAPPPRTAEEENLAYVIYTSGSTGKPKGVQLPHRAVVSFLLAMMRRPGLVAADVVPAVTTLTFDIAGLEIYLPLAVGGRVEVVGREEAGDGARLAARLRASGATMLQATPATWRLLLDAGWKGISGFRALSGGEALPRELADSLLERVGELWNVYGPTETAIWSSVGKVAQGGGPVLLGAPIANTRFAVVDRDFRPVPVGIPGELWIAGDGLARGYLNRADLTAERFVPDPFAAKPGARLYRTGDLVRWRPSGELEFLGRIDHQVKVRGFRIELGEIEAALLRHESVAAAAVVVREDAGDKRLVAYLAGGGECPPAAELRQYLNRLLPDYMVPSAFVVLDALPLTPSGKVDRKALPAPEGTRESAVATAYVDPRSELERTIAAVWRDVLKLERVGADDNFFDLGGHSLLAAQVHARLGEILGRELALVDLFRYPTVASLAAFLGGAVEPIIEAGLARAAARQAAAGREREAVAIIGMAGRFPGADGIEAFWENLRNGVESISFFNDEELRAAGVADSAFADPLYVRARGVVTGAAEFDAPFFGYSPREAEIIDPQQRLFLECAWEAFEDAGHEPARFPGDVGVFAGAAMNTYIVNFLSNPELIDAVGALQLMISNDKDFLATRVSYKLGLTGPSMSVQTACSTSLVAVHLACQSLLAGECDAALAGGVSLHLPQTRGYRHQASSVLSPDGHCRAFDEAAGGFVGGNGAAVVVLRRLSDALRDGDAIRAVIRGSAVNNDGSRRAGFTAPGVDGQARVVAQALAVAGVEPESIGYVEAHGTGTELGDPIEVEALRLAFGSRAPRGGCLLGSVKTNIGHLDSAAGVTSLIKAALALERRQIPPSLHFERPNPKLRLEESPFRVADRLTDWPASSSPRRAGVSSLGIGGTNAHVVLEEAPATEAGSASRPWQLLLLSARTPTALATAADRLAVFLREHPEVDFADAVHTLQTGRRSFPHRLALVCRDREDALSALAESHSPRLLHSEQEDAGRPVTFLFSGLGEHYPGMARDLYATEPTFRAALDECCDLLAPHLGLDLRRLLFPEPAETPREASPSSGPDLRAMLGRSERPASELDRTLYAQPAVFAVEYALASLLMAWGIRPQSLIGYSLGEYVAACLAGVLPLADALALVARRARLIDGLPAGAMLAVPLPEEEARGLLGEELSIAAVNGASLTVASGPDSAIADLERRLSERGLAGRRLPTTHAFHSRMMEPIRDAFAEMVAGLRLAAPRIPYVSNVTGTWITAEEATDPGYWVRHLCQSVRFADGLAELCREPERVLLEIGPGQGLSALALQSKAEILAVPTLRSSWDRQPDTAFLLTAVAKLWLAGLSVDWAGFYAHERRRRMPLPTYPFERRRYYIEPASALPRPDVGRPSAAGAASHHARPAHLRNAYVPAASGLERRLAEIWQQILGIAEVGVEDNFFDLGGHSLLATQMMSRLRDELALDLGVDAVFDAPTVAGLARRIEESRGGSPETLRPAITRAPTTGPLPLSFSQERLWFLHQLAPRSSAFNLAQAVRLRGDLDIASLGRCFGELVRRHEALRTVFRVENGAPVQVVQPPAPLPLPVVDLAALAAPERDAEARRLATDHQALPFDLASDRLLRTALLRFGGDDHALLLTMHHVVSDGWSIGVLVRELAALYRAFAAGEPSPLPELAVQYPDFAAWQRRVLAGETLQAEIGYWRSRLAGDPPPLRLPADRRRAGVQGFKLEGETLDLPAELTAELHALSRRQAASLYMTLLAGWKGLLARLTAEEDILVGAPIANRNRAEVEGLIGFFLNTLLLRTDVAGNPQFGDVLGRVRETALGAFAHQDLPLEMVLQAVHPERDADRTPFQIMFLLQNAPPAELAVPGLTFSVLDAEQRLGDLGTAAFEVGLTLVERVDGRGLAASITYNGLLFDRATIARLLERYGRLLTAAVANPEHRLWDFDLLAASERSEVLAWGSAAAAVAAFVPVHRAFEQRAAAAPEALAVIAGDRRLTYGELDRRSNRLANALGDLGIGPERAVGVAIERSPELLVALLAVLKAGAAYVPLDPSYPPERLTYILEDAGAVVLLTTSSVLAAAPALGEGRALPLLLESGVLDEGREDRPEVEADAENLAYLIYTSGSTGRPKGVMVRHGALAGYVAGFREEHRLGPQDRVLQFASIGFDTSAEEIYPCLTSGAALVLRDDSMLVSTPDFLRACGELGVTVLDLPTAFWHEMTASLVEEAVELPPSLRLIILGGERVLPERLAAWHELGHGHVLLVNTYGPTETTIVAARCELTPGLAVPGEVPIGRPVPAARAHVADPFLELAPAGVPGELCVAGRGLARGYLGRPDLTAERFVPDPWAEEPGARLYRTGDLVRWLPSADLEFLGRVDDQVKVRGYRVELREIEANLGLHPAVAAAVVVAREDSPGDRRLAAYVVPRNGDVAAAELRAFLRERLPDYMVPVAFVSLEALPTTPSGKVDRRALPAPERLRPESDGACLAPRTEAEETIAAIWSEVLGLDRVGVADNFFDLGGHSLLLPQVMHRLRSAFQMEIPLRTLFDEPTVEGLALAVEEILLADIESRLGEMEGAESVAG
jgi:amino acid adenylation domain-containing protein